MRESVMPMRRPDGSWEELKHILALIADNDLVWSFLEFDGVGTAPHGLTIPEFEAMARQERVGYVLTWPELLQFAEDVQQVHSCFLVATDSSAKLEQIADEFDSGLGALFYLRGFDNSQWEIGVQEDSEYADLFRGLVAEGDRADRS
ncbi:hypothetical protein [Amycolatopsis sp. CA-126428]|uniref:hypothetical protein n=1 Tax=Amycolatopsis sp. CA-126428 TaxID=2073158 RepID=UPI0011B0B9DA|nr:hypothetical protein [Amycolatopsis sp. CA-126428]